MFKSYVANLCTPIIYIKSSQNNWQWLKHYSTSTLATFDTFERPFWGAASFFRVRSTDTAKANDRVPWRV